MASSKKGKSASRPKAKPAAARPSPKKKPVAKKVAPKKATPKKTAPPKPAPKSKSPAVAAAPPADRAAAAAPSVPPSQAGARRHVLSLSFVRDGEEFLARLETNGGQISEFKNRALDQLLTLVASELEDLLE